MGYCALFGHTWATFAGHGQYAGQAFQVCTRCNKTHAGPPQVSDASTPFLIEMDAPVLEYPKVAE